MTDRLSAAIQMFDVDRETMRVILGIDPARLDEEPSAIVVATVHEMAPVDPPRKRKGLTGKRYRIARRRYSRTMRAWRRGLVPGRAVHTTGRYRLDSMEEVPGGAVSIGFTAAPW